MRFYNPTESRFTRHYREEVATVLSGIDCALNGERAIYCSSELTTGVRLYDCLREHHLRTSRELKDKLGEQWFEANVFKANSRGATEFAHAVRARLGNETMVITPAPFDCQGWSQLEYLFFWEELIRTRIKAVWFNENWEYSNGCTFELSVALDEELATFDREGNPLEPEQAIRKIEKAIDRLDADQFDTAKLREALDRLHAMRVSSGKW